MPGARGPGRLPAGATSLGEPGEAGLGFLLEVLKIFISVKISDVLTRFYCAGVVRLCQLWLAAQVAFMFLSFARYGW